jgi:hypothetical protein
VANFCIKVVIAQVVTATAMAASSIRWWATGEVRGMEAEGGG